MAVAIEVGWHPPRINPVFNKGGDWVVTFKPKAGDTWTPPAGMTVTAKFYTDASLVEELVTSEAVVDSAGISFAIESEDADTVPDKAEFRTFIQMPVGARTHNVPWLKGQVVRDD